MRDHGTMERGTIHGTETRDCRLEEKPMPRKESHKEGG